MKCPRCDNDMFARKPEISEVGGLQLGTAGWLCQRCGIERFEYTVTTNARFTLDGIDVVMKGLEIAVISQMTTAEPPITLKLIVENEWDQDATINGTSNLA